MPLIPIAVYSLLGIAGITATGYAADKVGEGVDDTADALIKIAVVGGVAYFLAKKYKVI